MARTPPVPKRPAKPATPEELRDAIRAEALRLGFDAVGFAPAHLTAEARTRRLQDLGSFVAQGLHGDMGWLGERTESRADPATLWPEARTILSLGLNYGPADDPLPLLQQSGRGVISVYAQGRDYHDVVKKKLKALGGWIHRSFKTELKVFVDTAPVMEKPLGMQAGIGWQGKHTNLVSRDYGSWLFLGEIYLALDLPPGRPKLLASQPTAAGRGTVDELPRSERSSRVPGVVHHALNAILRDDGVLICADDVLELLRGFDDRPSSGCAQSPLLLGRCCG